MISGSVSEKTIIGSGIIPKLPAISRPSILKDVVGKLYDKSQDFVQSPQRAADHSLPELSAQYGGCG